MAKAPKKGWHKQAKDNSPQEKDDGSRWKVIRDGRFVYVGDGVIKSQAERLAAALAEPAEIIQVK